MTTEQYLMLCLIRHYQGNTCADDLADLLKISHRNDAQRIIVSLYRKRLVENIMQPKLTNLGERAADGHYLIFAGKRIKVGELVRRL